MEGFVVSARKYRPTGFVEVVGQEHITTTLKNAISNDHLAQAFLFCGPRGVGKTTCARILAKTINCEAKTPEGEACNECNSCKSFNDNASLNITELDAASNNSVDDIRNLVDQVRYAPQAGKYKIYIIDEVHMLSNQAFNAFLKTLEEPPSYAIFILATTEKHKIIPTILSRCQIFDFNRIKVESIIPHLKNIAVKEEVKYEEDALHMIAQKADGALRDALSIFDQIVTFTSSNLTYKDTIANLHVLDYDYYFKIIDALWDGKHIDAILAFDEILNEGFDGHNFVIGLASHLRDLMMCQDERTLNLLEVPENIKASYKEQAQKVNDSFLLSGLSILNAVDINYKSSKSPRLTIELALMKLSHLNEAINLSSELKKKSTKLNQGAKLNAQNSTLNVDSLDSKEKGEDQNSIESKPEKIEEVNTEKIVESAKKVLNPENKVNPEGKKSLTSEGEIPRFAFTEEILSKKIELPDLDNLEKPKEDGGIDEPILDIKEKKKLTRDGVHNVWNGYVLKLEKEGKSSAEMLFRDREIEIHTEQEFIVIHLENRVQLDNFEELKTDLLFYLRQNLSNPDVRITAEVKQQKNDSKRLYTDQDKLNYLIEKKPIVKELKDRLGLDVDY